MKKIIATLLLVCTILSLSACAKKEKEMNTNYLNVMDFGAKGDGVTDDTDAIQNAILKAYENGGGTVYFPYTRDGYRIAKEGIEELDGRPLRSQLYIPAGESNICLMGEMPCSMLYDYMVRPDGGSFEPTLFNEMRQNNTFLFSDWDAPEETDPTERPWSILSAPEGDWCAGKFSTYQASIINLEFRVNLDTDKMYPTESAVNFKNVARVNIQDSQFCLNQQVGDTIQNKELLENPCHTVGLMTSGDQNDNNVLRNVAVQGFKYGFVCGEHVVAEYLYIHDCEYGISFHDSSHLSTVNHIVAQHNKVIIATTTTELFGNKKGECNVLFDTVDLEGGQGEKPVYTQLEYGVYDPENRFHGSVTWYEPWGENEFPVEGASHMTIQNFHEKYDK